MIHFKDNKNKSPLNTRWAQMSKQEQIIERKKMEIQAKLESQKQAAALAAQAKLANPTTTDDKNIFSNDGSFMNQFKALLEKQKQEKVEKDIILKTLDGEEDNENQEQDNQDNEYEEYHDDRKRGGDGRGQREKRRWNDRGRNRGHSPPTPSFDDRQNQYDNKNSGEIPSLMQIPVRPPDTDDKPWQQGHNDNTNHDSNEQNFGQGPMGPGPMQPGPGHMPPGMMGPGMMGPGPPGMGLGPNMGPGPNIGPSSNMGPGPMMGPGGPNMPPFMGGPPNFPMPPNFMGPNGPRPCGPMPPNMCGPNGPMPPFFGPPFPPGMMGPNGPPNSMGGPNGQPNPLMGPNGPNPMMGPNGPNSMMGPNGPNRMMGPNGPNPMMGPSGPNPMMGPNGPNPMMGPNGPNSMMGPTGPPNMMGPNGPPNMIGPNGPPNMMGGPNGPPNSMNSNMPFMGPRPPFGPNGPHNFGNGNGPPMPPFMPQSMPPTSSTNHSDKKPLEQASESRQLKNIPPPLPPNNSHIPKPKDEFGPKPPSQSSQDMFPPSVKTAASEVATNGDHWENVLKAIHAQDHNMWFLHNTNSNEYKKFRELVIKLRSEKKPEVKDEDKYEPEFSLEDDDSYDSKPVKEENSNSNASSNYNYWHMYTSKRDQTSSQSDEEAESKKERRKRKKKSRWGDDPPIPDMKPPGVVAPLPPGVPMLSSMPPMPPGSMPPMPPMSMPPMPPMPPMPGSMPPMPGSMPSMPGRLLPMPGSMPPMPGMPGMPPIPGMGGPRLGRIDEDGLKLSNVNRNNHALMQYAMTNYGTTNLNAEDWKKCEDNFKLNLLYQDMLKKRNEVERLAAAGKNKYDYDSDEDTSEGTWEHRLRAREMNATEKWADELTKQAAGKHHIGDFLPPEELKKFMEKYSAVKSGKEPDLSDYKEFKLKEDNVGFKMLQKLGWNEGQGLGSEGSGIVDPINKANQPVANLGLGANTSDNVSPDDDEFDAYRKRMMLAYRFRPNPLNNPRRPYY